MRLLLFALFCELLFRRLSRLHPGVDLADLKLPRAADFDCGHASLFDPGQAGVTGNTEVLAHLVHRVPTFQFFVNHIHIEPHLSGGYNNSIYDTIKLCENQDV